MICINNYENIFKFVKVTHKIMYTFFPDTVYIIPLAARQPGAQYKNETSDQ